MNSRRAFKIILSVAAALFFLWLAFREVQFQELWEQISAVKLAWIFPFTLALAVSHYLRAERWLLLLEDLETKPSRSTLFAGVMTGYMLNNIFPRLGEVARPVYVARRIGTGSGSLLGTIVLERVLDIACLLGFLLFISIYYISDPDVIGQIFGTESWEANAYLLIPAAIVLLFMLVWTGYRLLRRLDQKYSFQNPFWNKLVEFTSMFWKGITSVRTVKNWPLFILLSVCIWIGYAFMAYIPFWMLDLHLDYQLGIAEAVVVTIISAVGMAIPTPAGIGTYHLFVQQSLWVLYSVPLVTALTYATVTHGVMVIMVFICGGGALWFDKYHTLK